MAWKLVATPRDGLCPRCGGEPEERDYPSLNPPAHFRDCRACRFTWEVDRPRPPRGQSPYPPLATKEKP